MSVDFGFGLIISAFLLVQAVVLWQLQIRPIVASFLVAFVVNAILAWMFFFAVPAVMAVAIAACLGLAFHAAGKNASAQ